MVLPPADASGWVLLLLSPLASVASGLAGSSSRGQEPAPVDPGLVAVAVPFAERLPGLQPLRPHPLTVIQVGHPAAQRVLPVWPEEVHARALTGRISRPASG